jgi:protein gp37
MNRTKIDWTDPTGEGRTLYTWNPVTGCLHACRKTYCYAARMATRFAGSSLSSVAQDGQMPGWRSVVKGPGGNVDCHVLHRPAYDSRYPFGFAPTLHEYRLGEPEAVKKPARIFVVSMGDLFGAWVPLLWIEKVLAACRAAPQHEYIFLTKNPRGYLTVPTPWWPPNRYLGFTATDEARYMEGMDIMTDVFGGIAGGAGTKIMVSMEPLKAPIRVRRINDRLPDWIIVGGQTGPRARKPDPEWVAQIEQARNVGVAVSVKGNAR